MLTIDSVYFLEAPSLVHPLWHATYLAHDNIALVEEEQKRQVVPLCLVPRLSMTFRSLVQWLGSPPVLRAQLLLTPALIPPVPGAPLK
jgi:hypothetical protein